MAEAPDRKQRSAAALRENLYRRKHQQRARRESIEGQLAKAGHQDFSSAQGLGADRGGYGTDDVNQGVDRSRRDEKGTD